MKKLIFLCLLLCLPGCTPEPSPQLSDAKFLDVFDDVLALHRRYPFDPDSIKIHRDLVFKRHNISPTDIEQFLTDRRAHPHKWKPLITLLQKRYGDGAESQLKDFQKSPIPQNTKKTERQ